MKVIFPALKQGHLPCKNRKWCREAVEFGLDLHPVSTEAKYPLRCTHIYTCRLGVCKIESGF